MPRVPQAPPPGVFRNATPEATPGRWYDCNLIRFRGGQLQPVGGNVALTNAILTGTPRDILTWHDLNYVRWAAVGTDSHLYVYRFDTQVLTDITPPGMPALGPPGANLGWGMGDYGSGTYGTQRDASDVNPGDISALQGDKWSMDTFGRILLFVPTQDGRLWQWDPSTPATPASVVANAPIGNKGVVVTDQRQVVLIGSGNNPRMIAWSDQESLTVWTPDVTNLAGSQQLSTQGYCMTALKVPQGILIFTSNDVHLMSYVGPPFAYGIVQIGAGCSPISIRAPVAIGAVAIWPGLQHFWAFSGTVQPMPCDVQDWLYSLINRMMIGRIFGSPNPTFAEMWWDWPDEGSLECNRYVAVNYADRTWTIGLRARSAADWAGTMDSPILGGLAADGTSGQLYIHEFGWLDNGNARAPNGDVYAESGAITLGEGDRRLNCTQLVFDASPDIGAAIGYRFFPRENPADAASEYDTGLYQLVQNGLLDVRFSGRTVRMRMEATADGPFAVGRPRLLIRQGGFR